MSVKVRITSPLRELINCQEVVEVEGHNVLECLDSLAVLFPDIKRWIYNKQGQLFPYIHFYIDGDKDATSELTAPLEDGNELLILIMIAGG